MRAKQRLTIFTVLSVLVLGSGLVQRSSAQEGNSGQSWSSSSQQADPSGTANPFRTTTTHTEVNGRTIDKTVVEAMGPDGRYVPYSETERESVKVNDTTTRTVERSYGTTADGQRSLTQERTEESRKLAGGENKVVRTTSNPDANGALQVVQRTEIDSKPAGPGATDTNTTVFSADGSGGLSPSVRTSEHQRQTDPTTTEFTKSTSLSDGAGHWNISEVREGKTSQGDGGSTKEERVLRPDADGKMAIVERTVTRQADAGPGDKRETTETYSASVPGQAGDEGLQLVKRESTVQRTDANGARSTTRQVESPDPGDPSAGLRVTQEAIDIVRPGANGVAQQTSTVVTTDANGNTSTVWIDMGKSDKPTAAKIDTAAAPKKK